jgi:hypothetical protein
MCLFYKMDYFEFFKCKGDPIIVALGYNALYILS